MVFSHLIQLKPSVSNRVIIKLYICLIISHFKVRFAIMDLEDLRKTGKIYLEMLS